MRQLMTIELDIRLLPTRLETLLPFVFLSHPRASISLSSLARTMGRTNGLHLCFTAFNVIFSAGGVAMQLPSRSVELHTRTVNRDLCQLWIPTWPWTECQQFVTDYNLTMSNFIDMNPSVAADCYGWVGGTKYCVLMRRYSRSKSLPYFQTEFHYSQGPSYIYQRSMWFWG